MRALGYVLFITLGLIALLHVYWALGGYWPGTTEQSLINTVIGDPGLSSMPPAALTLGVAFLVFAAGVVALSVSGIALTRLYSLSRIAALVLILVFTARGTMGLISDIGLLQFPMTEPFRTYDLWLYSPLCLLLGAGFALLVFSRPKTKI